MGVTIVRHYEHIGRGNYGKTQDIEGGSKNGKTHDIEGGGKYRKMPETIQGGGQGLVQLHIIISITITFKFLVQLQLHS